MIYGVFLQVFVLRKKSSHIIAKPGLRYYICSLSLKTVVYKGQLTADQLWLYFTDLQVRNVWRINNFAERCIFNRK